jgi:hypothetical protein
MDDKEYILRMLTDYYEVYKYNVSPEERHALIRLISILIVQLSSAEKLKEVSDE